MKRSLYPVTQYLIERYYEDIGQQIPNGPNLLDHRNSEQLFDDIMSPQKRFANSILHTYPNTNNGDMEDVQSDSENGEDDDNIGDYDDDDDDDVFSHENLPSNSLLTKLSIFVNRCLTFGRNSYGYQNDLMIKNLQWEKQNAISYDQWKLASLKLDDLMRKNQWKSDSHSTLYDFKTLKKITEAMKNHRINENYSQLIYIIRTNWVRSLGNMGDVNLYRHCNVGTKTIIENYLHESEMSIRALLEQDELDPKYVLGILHQTKRNIGKTALVLSGGATFGLFHIGVLSALFEADLIPKVISGTSAGAIVASIFCVHTTDEIPGLLASVLDMEFNIFKDEKNKTNSEDILLKLARFLKGGSWFENKHLKKTMIGFLGNMTFREAYYRTGKILNITVSPVSVFEQPRLLNNLTAPNVLIWSAVCASCSVPGIFPATPLYEKDTKTGETREWLGNSAAKFVDGSVENDLPIARLSEMFNVDHIVACQVNPHVFPFLKNSLSCVGGEVHNELSAKVKQNLTVLYKAFVSECIHIFDMSSELGIATDLVAKLASVISQQYSGNITILPDLSMLCQSYELLRNPTRAFLLRETVLGARATWPKLSMIKNNCGQEFMLDKAITILQTKLLMSSSIKNPLRFTDGTFNLIRLTNGIKTLNKESMDHDPQVLDDTLMETENPNPLLFINSVDIGKSKADGRTRSLSLRLNPATAPDKYSSEKNLGTFQKPRRRHGKSLSFSVFKQSPPRYRRGDSTSLIKRTIGVVPIVETSPLKSSFSSKEIQVDTPTATNINLAAWDFADGGPNKKEKNI